VHVNSPHADVSEKTINIYNTFKNFDLLLYLYMMLAKKERRDVIVRTNHIVVSSRHSVINMFIIIQPHVNTEFSGTDFSDQQITLICSGGH